jgi:hypothetical protein
MICTVPAVQDLEVSPAFRLIRLKSMAERLEGSAGAFWCIGDETFSSGPKALVLSDQEFPKALQLAILHITHKCETTKSRKYDFARANRHRSTIPMFTKCNES